MSLQFLDVAAKLVMRPKPFDLVFLSPTPGCYILNVVTIGPVVSEKSFEMGDRRRMGS